MFKGSTLVFTAFFQSGEAFQRNVQVSEDIRPRFYSFAT